jgi:peroxiredoxin
MATLAVGETAPDFEIFASGNQRFRLSEALPKGPVVLLAYVLDFTGG